MVEVYNRNVVSNFKYTIKAVTIFMLRFVLKRLNADHKLLFRKLEKDITYYTKLNADVHFLCQFVCTYRTVHNQSDNLCVHVVQYIISHI